MWHLDGTTAFTIADPSRHGQSPRGWQIELNNPAAGIGEPRLSPSQDSANYVQPWNGLENTLQRRFEILQWRLEQHAAALQLDDAYVRGNDLIASYSADDDPIRWQAYWRLHAEIDAIELILSVNNLSLSGTPKFGLRSSWQAEQAWKISPGGEIMPLSNGQNRLTDPGIALPLMSDWITFQFVHPSDFRGGELTSGHERIVLEQQLFGDPMEKGVIRRARVFYGFIAKSEGEMTLAERLGNFLASPIPLTT